MINKRAQFWKDNMMASVLMIILVVSVAFGIFFFKDTIMSWAGNLPDYSAGGEHKVVGNNTSVVGTDFGNNLGISLKKEGKNRRIWYKDFRTKFYIEKASGKDLEKYSFVIREDAYMGVHEKTHGVDSKGKIVYYKGSPLELDPKMYSSNEITLNKALPLFVLRDNKLIWVGNKNVEDSDKFVMQEIDKKTGEVLKETKVTLPDPLTGIYGTIPKENPGRYTITLRGDKTVFYIEKERDGGYKIRREPLNWWEKKFDVVLWDRSYGEIYKNGSITLKKNSKKTNLEDLEKYRFDSKTKLFSKKTK